MEEGMMPIEFEEIKKLFDELRGSWEYFFSEKGKPCLENDAEDGCLGQQGVYVIRNQRGTVLHVGRTVCRSLRDRLNDHLKGNSSFTQYYNWFEGDASKLYQRRCTFQFLVEENDEKRAILEAYTTGRLCPRHIGTGQKTHGSSRRK
jgi:GIY-YIG catalytic domain-containing protein